MAHRNRWFTELKNGGSFHGELLVITRWYIHFLFHLLWFLSAISTERQPWCRWCGNRCSGCRTCRYRRTRHPPLAPREGENAWGFFKAEGQTSMYMCIHICVCSKCVCVSCVWNCMPMCKYVHIYIYIYICIYIIIYICVCVYIICTSYVYCMYPICTNIFTYYI